MKRLLLLFLLCFGLALPGVAADGTSFNPTTISVKSVGASIPVGTVITWPSNSWPSDRDNWLECNGQSISSAVYPELVALIGWNVPNYQGVFLRGYGGQTGVRTHYFQGKENRVCRRHGGVPCVPCFIFPKVSWSVNCSFPVLTVPPVWMTGVSQRHRLRHQAQTSVGRMHLMSTARTTPCTTVLSGEAKSEFSKIFSINCKSDDF